MNLVDMARQIDGDAIEDLRQDHKAELHGIEDHRDDYLCQVCDMVVDSAAFPSTWRPDITGKESAGNVCPKCVKAYNEQHLTTHEQFQLTAENEEAGEPGNIKSPADALRFITAGKAHFTVRSNITQKRFTYRVKRAKCSRCERTDCNCWVHPLFFVSVLTGSDNNTQYTYIGMIKEHRFGLSDGSKLPASDIRFTSFEWLWKFLTHPRVAGNFNRLQVWHEGKCGRCGRKLTVPESIANGIGPECATRMGL